MINTLVADSGATGGGGGGGVGGASASLSQFIWKVYLKIQAFKRVLDFWKEGGAEGTGQFSSCEKLPILTVWFFQMALKNVRNVIQTFGV